MQYVEEYAALLSRWTGAYVCAVHSYVGFNTPQGQRLLYGRIVFEPSRSEINATPFELKTEHVCAGRFVKSMAPGDTAAAIEGAKAGKMGHAVDLSPAENSSTPFSDYSLSDYHPLIAKLFIRGASRHHIQTMERFPRYLEWEMKVADTPFDTLDELLSHCDLPAWTRSSEATTLELVAKAPGEISRRSIIMNRKGVIECRLAKALDASKLKLGYRIFRKNHDVVRASARGDAFQWSTEDDVSIGKYCVDTADAPVLEAYLSYDGIPLDQSSIVDPEKHANSRYAVHQLFDPTLEILRQMVLAPERGKSQAFEGAVSTLLTLLGFSVSNYGRFPKLQDGPDIIAATPGAKLAVIECTIGLPNQNDKIAKLVHRTLLIREKLATAGYSAIELQPVIVTPLPREQVASDLQAARDHQIAVVCRENLEDAMNQVPLPPNTSQFFEHLKKLIPAPSRNFRSAF